MDARRRSATTASLADREAHDHRGAPARRVVDGELASDRLDEALGDSHAEPDPGSVGLVTEPLERLEHPRPILRLDARARVHDPQVDAVADGAPLDPHDALRGRE